MASIVLSSWAVYMFGNKIKKNDGAQPLICPSRAVVKMYSMIGDSRWPDQEVWMDARHMHLVLALLLMIGTRRTLVGAFGRNTVRIQSVFFFSPPS